MRAQDAGGFPALLAAYPDPDAERGGLDPARQFRRDRGGTRRRRHARPATDANPRRLGYAISPARRRRCSMMSRAASPRSIAQLASIDVTQPQRRPGPQHPRAHDQGASTSPTTARSCARSRCPGRFRHARPAAADRRLQATAARRRLGHAAVPAQRLGAQPVPDAAAAGAAQRRVSSSAGATSITKHVGYVSEPAIRAKRMDSGSTPASTATTTAGMPLSRRPTACGGRRSDPEEHPLPSGVIGPLLSDDDRWAIVEYLKIHRDLPATPADFVPPDCWQ